MTTPLQLLSSLGWTMLHGSWIVIAATAPVFFIQCWVGDQRPRLRYGSSILALLLVLLSLPAVFVRASSQPPTEIIVAPVLVQTEVSSAPHDLDQKGFVEPASLLIDADVTGTHSNKSTLSPVRTASKSGTPAKVRDARVSPASRPEFWIIALALCYCVGFAIMLARLGYGAWQTFAIGRNACPVASGFESILKEQACRIGLRYCPVFKTSAAVSVPAVIGVFRPVIVAPVSMLTGLSETDLTTVLLHELAHLRRLDHYTIWIQRLTETLFFFHPVVWYLSRVAENAREECCDDFVVQCGVPRMSYVETLYRVASIRMASEPPVLALGMTGKPESALRCRIKRLLRPAQPVIRRRFAIQVSAMIVPILLGSLAAIASLIPSGNSEDPGLLSKPTVSEFQSPDNPVRAFPAKEPQEASDRSTALTNASEDASTLSSLNAIPQLNIMWASISETASQWKRLADDAEPYLKSMVVLLSDSNGTTAESLNGSKPTSTKRKPAGSFSVTSTNPPDSDRNRSDDTLLSETELLGTVIDATGRPVSNALVLLTFQKATVDETLNNMFAIPSGNPAGQTDTHSPAELASTTTDTYGKFRIKPTEKLHLGCFLWAYSPEFGLTGLPIIYQLNGGISPPPTADTEHVLKLNRPELQTSTFVYPREQIDGKPFEQRAAVDVHVQPCIVRNPSPRRIQSFVDPIVRSRMARTLSPTTQTKGKFKQPRELIHIPPTLRELMEVTSDEQGCVKMQCGLPVFSYEVRTASGLTQSASPRQIGSETQVGLKREGTIEVKIDGFERLPEGTQIVALDHRHHTQLLEFDDQGTVKLSSFYGPQTFSLKTPADRPIGLNPPKVWVRIEETIPMGMGVVMPAIVKGRIRLSNGRPLRNALIQVAVEPNEQLSSPTIGRTTTNDEGFFSMESPVGRIRRFDVVEIPGELQNDFYRMDLKGSLIFRDDNPVLFSGQVYEHPEMTLQECTNIEGKVIDQNDQPIEGAWVATGTEFHRGTRTSHTGEFQLKVSQYWLNRTNKLKHPGHLYVYVDDNPPLISTIVSKKPWVIRHYQHGPLTGTYSKEAIYRLTRAVEPVNLKGHVLSSALSRVFRKAIWTIDEEAILAAGLDPTQLHVSGNYPGMPLHVLLDRILTPLNLKFVEHDDPNRSGNYLDGQIYRQKPEFLIVPK